MKPMDVVRLNNWIARNRDFLSSSERGTLASCSAKAQTELEFKVPTSALRELMLNNGIETKRQSKRNSEKMAMLGEIEKLTAENMELRRTLAKVAASDYVPDDVKELVFAGLKDEIKAAIFSNA